ncbi:MAG: hypothetical protein SAJ37_09630 [Oscillatoria sp. PMC 1068.18]|nr:hypothetical protein [Oscillatoria sp. PMC 1076.18]MEC4988995.1 hypothetical protein [Oscillatoria sp. PMC 1068.18]
MSVRDKLAKILLVEPDDEVRSLLVKNLKFEGYHVFLAIDEETALARTRDGCERPDLILLNQVGKTIDEYVQIGIRIRKNAQVSELTPIVVIAEKYGIDLEGRDIKVSENEYVTYLEDALQLMNLLKRLCQRS